MSWFTRAESKLALHSRTSSIPGYYVTPQSPTVAIRAFDDVGINADFAKVFINGPVTMVHVVESDLKHNTDVSVNTFYPRL